jgi:hypothetical protein
MFQQRAVSYAINSARRVMVRTRIIAIPAQRIYTSIKIVAMRIAQIIPT